MKESERISQRTCINDAWTGTMVWGLPAGVGEVVGGVRQRGKNWDNCTDINNKVLKRKKESF